jgi:hypothetical protein
MFLAQTYVESFIEGGVRNIRIGKLRRSLLFEFSMSSGND